MKWWIPKEILLTRPGYHKLHGAEHRVLPTHALPPRGTNRRSQQTTLCHARGFSLHAEARLSINRCHKLEHLCRYITRPAIANEWRTLNRIGDGVLWI